VRRTDGAGLHLMGCPLSSPCICLDLSQRDRVVGGAPKKQWESRYVAPEDGPPPRCAIWRRRTWTSEGGIGWPILYPEPGADGSHPPTLMFPNSPPSTLYETCRDNQRVPSGWASRKKVRRPYTSVLLLVSLTKIVKAPLDSWNISRSFLHTHSFFSCSTVSFCSWNACVSW
jgi:hypothetical protein